MPTANKKSSCERKRSKVNLLVEAIIVISIIGVFVFWWYGKRTCYSYCCRWLPRKVENYEKNDGLPIHLFFSVPFKTNRFMLKLVYVICFIEKRHVFTFELVDIIKSCAWETFFQWLIWLPWKNGAYPRLYCCRHVCMLENAVKSIYNMFFWSSWDQCKFMKTSMGANWKCNLHLHLQPPCLKKYS